MIQGNDKIESLELPEKIKIQVNEMMSKADDANMAGDYALAKEIYGQAFMLFPEPKMMYELASVVLTARGDALMANKEYEKALKTFQNVISECGMIGNPYLHLRCGQASYHLNLMGKAADELARAYMGGGMEIFDDEDPCYLVFLKKHIKF